jgi:hypothetical protein
MKNILKNHFFAPLAHFFLVFGYKVTKKILYLHRLSVLIKLKKEILRQKIASYQDVESRLQRKVYNINRLKK